MNTGVQASFISSSAIYPITLLDEPAPDARPIAGTTRSYGETFHMQSTIGNTPQLELALLRSGIDRRDGAGEHCDSCMRTLLIGERIYEYGDGQVRCALCREGSHQEPAASHTVHGPAFGNSIRVLDRRPLRRAA